MDTPSTANGPWSLVKTIKQSGPVDPTSPYDTSALAGKTILITGGASGFGKAFALKWASHGANIIIGDLNDAAGEAMVAELRCLPGSSKHHHYQHCDVTKWEDQVALFRMGVEASPTGGIDAVVAGAGIVESRDVVNGPTIDMPVLVDEHGNPPRPGLKVLDVNLTGVMYTTHLAIFWLQRNNNNTGKDHQTKKTTRDRHLLLISSIAGVTPLPGQVEYTASKHAVMGLFRTLRGSVWRQGIRCNVINPYFVETPLINWRGMALLAGGGKVELSDVVDAATRLMADETIVGRGLVIGPRFKVVDDEDGNPRFVEQGGGREQAVWELYGHDYEQVEVFVWRFVGMLNAVKKMRGWVGTVKDLFNMWRTRRAARRAPKKARA
ncbi:hypothetical protein B0H66DRAFT_69513 [Apodospora peruviana]|uniref:Uncharacterized protein n=1 Tax=Apodospora peruviana TaxID=516989 RepID=A0AAE0IT53_9PEZI|nr:hypothetical protein B0H66DRAFT_69513 [Apodospora peruviana]